MFRVQILRIYRCQGSGSVALGFTVLGLRVKDFMALGILGLGLELGILGLQDLGFCVLGA